MSPPVLALLLVAILAAYNLEHYPRTWYDEGINLHAAANLAQSGRYGIQYRDRFQPFDTAMSTGPTVIAPAALSFKVLGVGLVQGRLVMVGYILLAAAGLYAVGRQLYGRGAATVAILLFASTTQAGPFAHGRHLLGEIPALAFLYWGAALFVAAWTAGGDRSYVGAGLLFGLAVLTKNQFALLVPLVLGLWLLGFVRPSGFSGRQVLLLLAAMVAPTTFWYAFQLWSLGPTECAEHLRQMSMEAAASAYISPLARALAGGKFLVASGFATWGAVGLLYVGLLAFREKRWLEPQWILLPAFALLWLGWYVGFSTGWVRYAVPAVVTCNLFLAKLLCDLGATFGARGSRGVGSRIRALAADPPGTALLAVMAMMVLSGIAVNAEAIGRATDKSPLQFASVVADRVEADAVVEASEWEIDFLTGRSFVHPPFSVVMAGIAAVSQGKSAEALHRYRVSPAASYLVDGPFSKLAGIYRSELSRGEFQRIASVGEYDLYRRDTGRSILLEQGGEDGSG